MKYLGHSPESQQQQHNSESKAAQMGASLQTATEAQLQDLAPARQNGNATAT